MATTQKQKYYCDMNHTYGLEVHHHNQIWYGIMHTFGLYGIYLILTGAVPWVVAIPSILYGYFSGLGITGEILFILCAPICKITVTNPCN